MITEYDIRMCLKEAREDGREEGRVEGKAEGKAESKMEIAKAMLEQGIDSAIVATCTGLSSEEIKALATVR